MESSKEVDQPPLKNQNHSSSQSHFPTPYLPENQESDKFDHTPDYEDNQALEGLEYKLATSCPSPVPSLVSGLGRDNEPQLTPDDQDLFVTPNPSPSSFASKLDTDSESCTPPTTPVAIMTVSDFGSETLSEGEGGLSDEFIGGGTSSTIVYSQDSLYLEVDNTLSIAGPSSEVPEYRIVTKLWQPGNQRRSKIPDKPKFPLELRNILRSCIGKNLSKISLPVFLLEPLSMLQRLNEEFEYSGLLDIAATIENPYEQMAYVAAFAVSSYSTTYDRTTKPFDPLLGETFECDRTQDYGWKAISEQVSIHPSIIAQHCEGSEWTHFQELSLKSKFHASNVTITPKGCVHLAFKNGNHYTWKKVITTVHNTYVGRMYVDHNGEINILNIADGTTCHVTFFIFNYLQKENRRKIRAYVHDPQGELQWLVKGFWNKSLSISRISKIEILRSNPIFIEGPPETIWEIATPLPDAEKFYNFSRLAIQLNEGEGGVAPTDSRNRPDLRLLEEGKWEEANRVKIFLEERQRAIKRVEEKEIHFQPVWFKEGKEPFSGDVMFLYQGKYWTAKARQDWSKCPNIF